MEEQKESKKKIFSSWYDKNYKKLLLLPLLLLIFSGIYLYIFYQQNDDFIIKDISLTGGTSITIFSNGVDSGEILVELSAKLEDVRVREVYDFLTREKKELIITTKSSAEETKLALEEYLEYELDETNSSIEFTGSSLSNSFYQQLIIAIFVAFVLMAVVVFIIFRSFIPSAAVIISAFADILMTLVAVNLLGMNISSAGIVAFLLLIGYSVDTDILLTTRLLKRRDGEINERMFNAFKTGITMTLTSLVAVSVAYLMVFSFSFTLGQIFSILAIGLVFDIFNTWITNASILKWYLEKRK